MLTGELVRLSVLISLIIHSHCVGEAPVEVLKQWSLLNFNFPFDWPVNDKSLFNAEQIVTTGFEVGVDRIFLATPRLFSGVPATISSVPRDVVGDSPVLQVNSKDSVNKHKLNGYLLIAGFPRLVTPHCRSQAVQLQ